MKEEPIKICSDCGAEYSLHAQSCADCGGKLVFPQDYKERFVPLEEEEEQICIREGVIDLIEELKEHMTKSGIRAVIRLHRETPKACPTGTLYGLYVTPADEAAAKEISRTHWLQGAPDHATSFRYSEQELAGVCPACSTSIPEKSAECPECGLIVKSEEETATCPDCDAEVGDEVNKCPNCGAEFE